MNRSRPIPLFLQLISLFATYIIFVGFGEIIFPRLYESLLGNQALAYLLADITINCLTGGALLLVYRQVSKRSFWPLLQTGQQPGRFLIGSVAGFLAVSLIVLILYLKGDLIFVGWNFQAMVLGLLVFFLTVSWVEEVLTRGVLQHVIAQKSVWLSIVVVAVLFGLLHLGNPGHTPLAIPNTILIGLILGIATLKDKNLRFALGFHFTWNASLAVIYGLTISGIQFSESLLQTVVSPTAASGASYGIEGGYLVSLLFVVILVFQMIGLRKGDKDEETSGI